MTVHHGIIEITLIANICCILGIVRNEEVLLRVKEQRNILHEIRKLKANWIGHILRRNCLLQRVIGGKVQGGIEVTERQGRRRRKLLDDLNPLNPELNPICYLLALLGAHHFLHVSRIRVKLLTFGRLMSYIYGAPILDVSRSHTTTQHSR